ncbi:caspase family protein [Streptomyces sp. NPDC096012]|uniref:HD domain-containing protein n=1 Tax=Streptomyces sp. NPDC096012 TaxID=3155684 RepID=UPI00336A5FD1
MDEARKALLIGIGQAPAVAGTLEPIEEPVEADLRLMSTALQASGYEVETLPGAGLSLIKSRIYEAAAAIPAGGTLLLYFTGHGLRVGRTDYLVPADAVPPADGKWRAPYTDLLLPANISPLLADCRAGTVLWLIDACRTDTASDGEAFGNSIDNGPPTGGFAVLTGCSAGEHSGFTSEGSFFTRGLADALGPLTPARTVQDVFATARARTREAARRHGLSQTPLIRYGTHAETETREREICGGRPLLEAWLDAARSTPLWQRVTAGDAASVPGFQDALGVFTEECARSVHLAQQRLPFPDPWADDGFPVRLLCDRLPQLLPADQPLAAIEVALLVAAPFLHEVAWAQRLSQAAEVSPAELESPGHASAHRRHYEQIVGQYGRLARQLAHCRARDRAEDANAIVMWLVHRWIADRFRTDDEGGPATGGEQLAALLGVPDERVQEVSQLLLTAASALAADEPFDDSHTWASRKVLLSGGYQTLRIRPLAALLRLAGLLAVDVRTLPDIVAEHLAVTDPVLPQQTVAMARGLSWHREGNALHLDALCPHQAMHAALAEVTEEADRMAAETERLAGDLREAEAVLLSAVPGRVTDRDLRPLRLGSHPAYEVPLLRFHLAQTEVRDLLMGEQLYGGRPELALRELYQNAMDACRYRAMRREYLNRIASPPADWAGRIVFTQGRDERGRYVECRDNGVGMSAEQLKQTFTRAGSRFERSRSFRQEQSRWLRHDPALRLYPNSRFGIGVFSYFMLADEMTIVTRQVSPEGIPAEHALRVEIPSSGSLFRIRRHDGSDDGLAEGGTRVRLYLREHGATDRLSCVSVLRGLVRVSEFTLEAGEEEGPSHAWEPGVLQPAPGETPDTALTAVPDTLWWVLGEGATLCDGIVTDHKPFGYVVNLTGSHAGKLSVSRNELQAFDAEWVGSLWRQGAKALVDWPHLSLDWLAHLDEKSTELARVLDGEWRGKGLRVPGWHGESVELDRVGWFHVDRAVADTTARMSQAGFDEILPWRSAVLGVTRRNVEPPASLAGHPVPAPGDARIATTPLQAWSRVVAYAARHRLQLAEVLRRQRCLRIVHTDFAPLPVREGDLDWVPDEADLALAQCLHDAGMGQGTVVGGAGTQHWGGLVLASARLSLPLGELVRRLARFTALLPAALPEVPARHEHHVCAESDLDGLFLRYHSGQSVTWRLPDGPLELSQLCENGNVTAQEVARRLGDFAWLGWTPPAAEELARWQEIDEELYDVVNVFASETESGSRVLPWAATVDYADTLETDLAEADERLAALAEDLGLRYRRRYTDGDPSAAHTPSSYTAILVRRLAGMGIDLEAGVSLEDLAVVRTDDLDLETTVDDLRASGVRVPDDISLLFAWDDLSLRDRYVLSGKEPFNEEEDFAAAELTPAALFHAAQRLNEPLKDVWALAARHAGRFGLTVPRLPVELADFLPTETMKTALVDQLSRAAIDFGTAAWVPLTPLALARYARRSAVDAATAYLRLRPLRAIGALVPELSAADVEALRGAVPDARDVVALGSGHRVSRWYDPYCALDLVSIAGRLGEPLPRTVARIAPYLPLCSAPSALPQVPDTVPLWQDLALLTQGCDGLLPALEGTVTAARIRLAARATGESEAWVAKRLRLYAPMFGLVGDEWEGSGADDGSGGDGDE